MYFLKSSSGTQSSRTVGTFMNEHRSYFALIRASKCSDLMLLKSSNCRTQEKKYFSQCVFYEKLCHLFQRPGQPISYIHVGRVVAQHGAAVRKGVVDAREGAQNDRRRSGDQIFVQGRCVYALPCSLRRPKYNLIIDPLKNTLHYSCLKKLICFLRLAYL